MVPNGPAGNPAMSMRGPGVVGAGRPGKGSRGPRRPPNRIPPRASLRLSTTTDPITAPFVSVSRSEGGAMRRGSQRRDRRAAGPGAAPTLARCPRRTEAHARMIRRTRARGRRWPTRRSPGPGPPTSAARPWPRPSRNARRPGAPPATPGAARRRDRRGAVRPGRRPRGGRRRPLAQRRIRHDDAATPPASATPTPPPSTSAATRCPPHPASRRRSTRPRATASADDVAYTLTLKTNCGDIVIATTAQAPETVNSMLSLADEGYFDGSPCHRLTTEGLFVLQCGDPTGTGTVVPATRVPDENLPKDGEKNYPKGTVAMANSGPGHRGQPVLHRLRRHDPAGRLHDLGHRDRGPGRGGAGGLRGGPGGAGGRDSRGLDRHRVDHRHAGAGLTDRPAGNQPWKNDAPHGGGPA